MEKMEYKENLALFHNLHKNNSNTTLYTLPNISIPSSNLCRRKLTHFCFRYFSFFLFFLYLLGNKKLFQTKKSRF